MWDLHRHGILFDDQGTLDFIEEEHGSGNRKATTQASSKGAQCRPQPFVQELFKLAGRPFKESKHQAPCQRQVHLGLLNDFIEFQHGSISIKPRVGKNYELILILAEMKAREPRTASATEVLHLAGSLVFLLYSCFDKVARGGLRPFYDWVTEHVDRAFLWRTKDRHLALTPSVMGGIEFFLGSLPLLEPRVYYLGRVERDPLVVCSDAEWSPPPHLPQRVGRVYFRRWEEERLLWRHQGIFAMP